MTSRTPQDPITWPQPSARWAPAAPAANRGRRHGPAHGRVAVPALAGGVRGCGGRTGRLWAAWLLTAVAAALLGLVLSTADAGPVWADPTPVPGSPAAPTPSASGAADPRAGCDASAQDRITWCFLWAVRVQDPPEGALSHWLTVCSQAKTVDEQSACDTASATLPTPPPDNSPSILMDGPPRDGDTTALVSCELFRFRVATDPAHGAQWTAKRARCDKLRSYYLAGLHDPGGLDDCGATDVACKVGQRVEDAVSAGVRSGIQGLIDLAVQGLAYLLSWLAKLVFSSTAIAAPDDTFYSVYNTGAGVLLVLVFVFFLISVVVNGLRVRGPGPVATLGGLVRALLGMTFAGGIAWTMVALWDEATNALIDRNAATGWEPAVWVTAFSALASGVGSGLVALAIAAFSIVGLVVLFIMMLFRGVLTTGAALFGMMAMAGQVMPETRHWGRRWFWTVNALASSKFFIALLWIYGTRGAYQSDLFTALKALLLIWLMVLAPGVLLRLTAMWDGYLTDVNASAVLLAVSDGVDDFGGGRPAGGMVMRRAR